MIIKLKLGVSEDKKYMEVTPDELGYTDEDWEEMSDEGKQSVLTTFIDSLTEQPYWYLESFKTL